MAMNILERVELKIDEGLDRVVLTLDEWYALRDVITQLKKQVERLTWSLEQHD